MKPIDIVITAILLAAGVGVPAGCSFVQGISDVPDPCLAQVEAAMRAMEPYSIIDREYDIERLHGMENTILIVRIEILKKDQRAALEVVKLWNEAKRACWKEKP